MFSPVIDGMAADSGWGWGTDGHWHILVQYFQSSTCTELSLWNRVSLHLCEIGSARRIEETGRLGHSLFAFPVCSHNV